MRDSAVKIVGVSRLKQLLLAPDGDVDTAAGDDA
jgi:hypothetical protein